ncbi:MAG TPA: type II toxin-antitoxin system RelE/ParE family toxin [Caulobacteraceae bacterium]|jgi:plasmid stabilization system protein ParE
MTRTVAFHADAEKDLAELIDWIAERASVATARRYADRIRRYCDRFDLFPERGTKRDDLFPQGLRTVGFERRVTIVFTVTDEQVVILRLLYGGRNVEAMFSDDDRP